MMLRGAQLDELHRACREQACIHPLASERERLARWAVAPCVTEEAATAMSPVVMRSRLLHALQARPLATYTLTEQAGALELVMGALGLHPYPPVARAIQHDIAHMRAPQPLLPEVEKLRAELAALDADAFRGTLQEMLNPLRSVEQRHPNRW
jgi:hypothetical protein